jgi:hypothetical protein
MRLLLLLLLTGCAVTPVPGPSTAIVKQDVNQAKMHNDLAVIANTQGLTAVERIEAKAAVINKYWDTAK